MIASPIGLPWPTLDQAAYHGLPGDVVATIAPETESDPAALLVSFLLAFGNSVGPNPHFIADGAAHPGRLFAVLVGETAKARKGTSWRNIRRLFETADPAWVDDCITGGLASGEGLIAQVRDPIFEKRCLAIEEEFARTLTNSGKGNNTLSPILREAWDNGNLRTMTKKPMAATGAHISVLAHVTVDELQKRMTYLHKASGFSNRFMFFCVRRTKLLPTGGNLDINALKQLGVLVLNKLTDARDLTLMRRSDAAEALWAKLYQTMDKQALPGELGLLTNRAEAHVLRLSLTYALTDASPVIDVPHLEAAWALWSYARQSLEYLFGLGDEVVNRLYAGIKMTGSTGMTLTEQNKLFQFHRSEEDLRRARVFLEQRGLITTHRVETGGRPAEISVAMR